MKPPRLINEVQEGFRHLFARHHYDIMVTLRFEYQSFRGRHVHKYLAEFARNVAKSRKTQVAGYAIFNSLKHPHAHLLLFGKTATLEEISNSEVEAFWRYGAAHVCQVNDDGAAFYVALNITPGAQDLYDVFHFNKRLLNKSTN